MIRALLAAMALAISPLASAGGTASSPPPPAPEVDFSSLAPSADVQNKAPDGTEHPVRARLLTEADAIPAGSTVRVGVLLEQKPGWHTYWKSPGDIGLPTDIQWTLPEGWAASPHEFPVPQRFQLDDIVSYGYEHQVLLISNLQVPGDVSPGTYSIVANASWLVCQSSCIPGSATLTLPVEVAAAGSVARPTPWAPLFPHYAAQHTVAEAGSGVSHEFALSQSAIRPGDKFEAIFLIKSDGASLAPVPTEATWPTFTAIAGTNWILGVDHPVEVRNVEGGIAVVVKGEALEPDPLPDAEPIGGLVQVKIGDKWVRTEIDEQLPWAAKGAQVAASTSPLWKLAAVPGGAAPPKGDGPTASSSSAPPGAAAEGSRGLLGNLLFAFVGGLILNIMPCVLPVLTLKLYSLVEQAEIGARERRIAGVAYTVGIVFSFLALAGSVLVARYALGVNLGWGSQFQYPPYVAALATVVFAFGLSLFGVYDIPSFGMATAHDAAAKEGVVGYFFTGVFATLLATPCSAPFLGTAVAFAFAAPPAELLAIFAAIGIGLAAPFLIVAFVPALFKLMPRPGEWMDWLKELLGFSLIATTIWLVRVLEAQIGIEKGTWFLVFLMFIGIAAWVYGRWGGVLSSQRQHAIALAASLGIATGAGWYLLDLQVAQAAKCDAEVTTAGLSFDHEIPFQPFSPKSVESLAGTNVFVDFTADWCLTCKVNERTVLETEAVRGAMKAHGIVPLKADWTLRDPEITSWLAKWGKAGVPFYLVIPADRKREPIPLPEVITPSMVTDAIALADNGPAAAAAE
jgi:thiol:disulfide interchange protein DsbD